ncbi:hypothetical protein O1611_g5603 [Lasiodiplodia mahajangana]|uniref:Uncharacterized protein n=1 Tax=Lasiodiplodia mahajangana TaxID=1108764 RepID=A0ACC2JKI4_9PEZI|nr:hypothetical protein O1611_g5603 [Lasiodiplodia mahajangana]
MQSRLLVDVRDDDDDWTGVTSPAERRKRQNRLNQRAYRKRKHLQSCRLLAENTSNATGPNVQGEIRSSSPDPYSLSWIAELSWGSRHKILEFKEKIFLDYSLRLKAPSDLPTTVRLNVISALASNAVSLSIPFADLESDESVSPFNRQGPPPPGIPSPNLTTMENLRPTALQKAVVHHPWVDVFPIPGIRDNILRGLAGALFDEDELCGALFNLDNDDDALAPIVVWADPSQAESWELSPTFLKKWGFLIMGCPEVLDATNAWRRRRGQRGIDFICSGADDYNEVSTSNHL